jgi:protein translocase SecG subunit
MSFPILNLLLGAAAPVATAAAQSAAAASKTAPAPAATLAPNALQTVNVPPSTYLSPLALTHPWITHTLAAFFVISAVSLVLLLAFQTTKQEGLSGTIGGRVESAYRTRLGGDQQLARLTSYVAIGFAFFALLLSLTGI